MWKTEKDRLQNLSQVERRKNYFCGEEFTYTFVFGYKSSSVQNYIILFLEFITQREATFFNTQYKKLSILKIQKRK